MGYQDPQPLIDRISQVADQLRKTAGRGYDDLPGPFQDHFVAALAQQTESFRALAEDLRSCVQAAAIAQDTGYPDLPDTESAWNWYPVAGMPVWNVHPTGQWRGFADYVPAPDEAEIVIYLDKYKESDLEVIQAAAFRLADALGYTDFSLTDEQLGSVFRSFLGKLKSGLSSDFVKQRMQELEERASIEVVGRSRAETDAIKTASAVNLIASLSDIPNAVVRVGGLLIIKQTTANGASAIITRELSTREIRALELNPGIQMDPQGALQLLAAAVAQLEEDERY